MTGADFVSGHSSTTAAADITCIQSLSLLTFAKHTQVKGEYWVLI